MLLALLLAATPLACPIEQARYSLRDRPDVTARFHTVPRSADWPTGIALSVRVVPSGRSYWLLPWQGGTDGRTNAAWVGAHVPGARNPQDGRRDIELLTTDATYRLSPTVPAAGDTAPAHLLMPDLPRLVWLSTASPERDGIARQFFDLVACDRSGTAEAMPSIDFPPIP